MLVGIMVGVGMLAGTMVGVGIVDGVGIMDGEEDIVHLITITIVMIIIVIIMGKEDVVQGIQDMVGETQVIQDMLIMEQQLTL